MKLKQFDIDKLQPHPENYNRHPESQLDELVKSLDTFEQYKNIVVWNGLIIAGNGLYEAARRKGLTKIYAIDRSDLSESQAKALLIADNATGAISDPDLSQLHMLLDDLGDIEIPGVGDDFFVNVGMEWGVKSGDENDKKTDSIPENVETVCKTGQLWQLGNHKLLCGDCTVEKNVEKLMGSEKADLVLTDPPYGINVVKCGKVGGGGVTHFGKVGGGNIVESSMYRKIKNDETTDIAKKFYELYNNIEFQIIFGGNYFTDFLPPSRCWLIWDKEMTGNFSEAEMAWTSFKTGGVKILKYLWNGLSREGNRKDELKKRVHPTQKPVGLFEKILINYSKENHLIFDPFGGSGTTLIACEKTKRKCRMIEIDEHYCDVIIKRWEEFTGKKAELI